MGFDGWESFTSIYFETFTLPLTWIPLWVGVALHQTLVDEGYPKERMHLKWPNDLYLDWESKGAGILCEKTEKGIAVGVGVNLISHPDGIGRETSSLQALRGLPLPMDSAETLLQKLIENLKQEPSVADLKSAFEQKSLFKSGESVAWLDSRSGISNQGKVQGLGDFGELRVLSESGDLLKLYSEEISGIRKKELHEK